MAKRKRKTGKKPFSIALLPSMLIIYTSALMICVALTIILFSVFGTYAYAMLKSVELRPQMRGLADASASYMSGESSLNDVFLLTRASEATFVVLDENGDEYIYHDPKQREGREPNDGKNGPGDMPPGSQGGIGGDPFEPPFPPDEQYEEDPSLQAKHRSYVAYCKSVFQRVMASGEDEDYRRYEARLGVLIGQPVVKDGEKLGAAFLIIPVNDLNEASKSVVFALVVSALAAALLMILPIFLITKWLVKPIKKMTDAALVLADGDYSERVEVAGSLEVRELGESFNKLADNLKENIGDLVVERNRLRAILDGLGEGIVGTNPEHDGVQSNAAAVQLLGGREGDDLKSLPCYKAVDGVIGRALTGDENAAELISCGERTIRISASPIHEENGAVAGAVALLMDVTEAERLEQTRKDYVANVSHELRTPLASIRGIADMLNDGLVKSEADKTRYYGYILRECNRLSTLINDLLELSRLQSGGVALELRRMELYELAADVADRMSGSAEKHGMSIVLAMPEGKYYAHSNADRVEQVLITLTDNAVKHGTPGGTVSIGLEEAGDKWLMYVENPADVDKKDIDHLFERFYKADIAHTGEGTGLGLAIAEEVLHLMGERIRVDYDGNTIRFTFTVSREK